MIVSETTPAEPIIFAPATPAGQSGVAVFRISGQCLAPVLAGLGLPPTLPARRATLRTLCDVKRETIIDQALVLFFAAPHSFTGEEVLELHTHGSAAVRAHLLEVLGDIAGCRLAEAGEFSRRAFRNGKMDLLQAEGIADLIAAETAMQQQQAIRQMGGALSGHYESMRHDVLTALALLEAYLDFPDEEIPKETLQQVQTQIDRLKGELAGLLSEPACGEMIRDGLTIAIIGPPNAGKSSLMNRLAGRDVAIVSPIAGTTRDRIEVQLNVGGYLVRLIDTAGLHEQPSDSVEAEGIKRAREAAAKSEISLVVLDIVSDLEQFVLPDDLLHANGLVLFNKIDSIEAPTDALPSHFMGMPVLGISAHSAEGIDTLLTTLQGMISRLIDQQPSPLITRARHRHALREALEQLESLQLDAAPLECSAEELRLAARGIGKITGHIDVDEVLGVIFSTFCIGK